MRSYSFDFGQARTRRAGAIVAFERAMRGGWTRRRCGPSDLFRDAVELVQRWRERIRQREQLARLDARMLRDVGIIPSAAERECNKPFWRS